MFYSRSRNLDTNYVFVLLKKIDNNMKIDNNIIGQCLVVVDKSVHDILDVVLEAADFNPKNKFTINCKSPYKEYVYNQYEI